MLAAPETFVVSVPWLVGAIVSTIVGNVALQGFIGRVIFQRSVIDVLTNRKTEVKAVVMEAVRDSKPEVMALINEMYATQLNVIDGMKEEINKNRERMSFIDGEIGAHRAAVDKHLTEQVQATNAMFKEITATLKEIQEEAQQTAIAFARLEERSKGWDGTFRRETDPKGGR